jgi:hypothetical protein
MKTYGANFTERIKYFYWYIRMATWTLEGNVLHPVFMDTF